MHHSGCSLTVDKKRDSEAKKLIWNVIKWSRWEARNWDKGSNGEGRIILEDMKVSRVAIN